MTNATNATKVTVATFGTLAGLAGIEHGIGEVLQGNIAPNSVMILSWPGSEFFRIVNGEPAMTIIPNLLVTGLLAIFFSLIFLVWATTFVERKHGGLVLILLSIVMLLVGAGFGPPLLGIIVGAAATRINAPLTWWRTRLSLGARQFLGKLWAWSYAAGLIAWLLMFPGTSILAHFFGVNNQSLLFVLILCAFGLLLLTIFAGFVHDLQEQIEPHTVLTTST